MRIQCISLVIFFALLLGACSAPKDVTYFQGVDDLSQEQLEQMSQSYSTKISPDDLLTITVNSDFELTNGVDTIPFAMRTSEPGITGDISNGGTVATFSYNNTVDKLLTVIVKFKDMLIGSFSGEITFNVDFHTDEDD